ncbi:MAG: hypothetical protein A2046_00470 [Bacteroidetes bacterium GWA2_30_7]|nr:MAG: hypothetical protein A2046_00470 [Bacteroidetes bacterium GWA2_30_7]
MKKRILLIVLFYLILSGFFVDTLLISIEATGIDVFKIITITIGSIGGIWAIIHHFMTLPKEVIDNKSIETNNKSAEDDGKEHENEIEVFDNEIGGNTIQKQIKPITINDTKKSKKNKIMIAILYVVLVVLLFSIGYFLHSKFSSDIPLINKQEIVTNKIKNYLIKLLENQNTINEFKIRDSIMDLCSSEQVIVVVTDKSNDTLNVEGISVFLRDVAMPDHYNNGNDSVSVVLDSFGFINRLTIIKKY